jgi:16S rRNA (guanine1207-N2)-methyltransferase
LSPLLSQFDSSLIKKRIHFNLGKVSLQLDLSESLFSSFDVDMGTKVLLNSLRKNVAINYAKILDLGCGYGPMGLFLKAQDPSRDVHMVDRDALAVTFASHNAQLNGLSMTTYPSLDYERVKDTFSLIVTNFPAKIETKGLEAFVYGASAHLTADGALALVVVRELIRTLERILDDHKISILYQNYKKNYSIFHVAFSEPICQPEDKYERKKMTLSFSRNYQVRTAYGLPEFDTLNYGTRALYSLLREMKDPAFNSALMLEPGQGHGAIAAMDVLKCKEVVLCSRDLLSLTFAAGNLRSNFAFEPRIEHAPYLCKAPKEDLTIWSIQRKNDIVLNAFNLQALSKMTGHLIVYGKTSSLRSLLRGKNLEVKGYSLYGDYCAQLLRPI